MKLEFDPRILTDIIGRGQYTQFKSIIAEYVANAWDAEASKVKITVPEDFTNDPIIIEDNGNGIDINTFKIIGSNVQLNSSYTRNFARPLMGKKGIGRFAGFACAKIIKYQSVYDENSFEITFDREEILKFNDVSEIEIPLKEQDDLLVKGTKVTIDYLDTKYSLPSIEQIERDLTIDFGIRTDFEIYLNDNLIKKNEIRGETFDIDQTFEDFGHVSGNITIAKTKSNKFPAGIIIRVKNRRVEGPTFFDLQDNISGKVLHRIYGDINADGLEDIISSGREAFIMHDERYNKLVDWLKEQIASISNKIEEENTIDTAEIIYNLPKFKERIEKLPSHLKDLCRNYIKRIAPNLSRIKNNTEMLEIIGLLVIRASENADFYAVLEELQKTETNDITTLAKVLKHWGFGEIARLTTLIQNRLRIVQKFSEIVHDNASLELQDLHKMIEYNLWLLDEKYNLFTSNKSIKKILNDLIENNSIDKDLNKRPDMILKRDRDDFIIVEFKRPSHIINYDDVTQTLTYRDLLLKHHFPNARDIDIFIVGREFEQGVLRNYPKNNSQKIYLMTLDEIIQNTHDRLKWLEDNIKDEYLEFEKSINETDFITDIK
jgi:hypothetical protein